MLKSNADKKLTGQFYLELQSKFEFIEDLFDLVSESSASIFNAIRNLGKDFSPEKFKELLTIFKGKASQIDRFDTAYFAGIFIFEVVLGVILAFFTGGATAVAQATNAAEKATAFLKIFAQEMVATATLGISAILQLFRILITKFIQACKNGWIGLKKFLDKLLNGKLDDIVETKGNVLDEVGMADNIETGIKISVDEFDARLKKLSKIKPSEALDYLDDALIYFNHHVVNGKVVQISDTNCVNVVQAVEEFLNVGKILKATSSKPQNFYVLAIKYNGNFLTYNFSTLSKVIREGERGILLCEREGNRLSHVINIIKKEGKLIFVDGQVYTQKMNLIAEFKTFKYLKTK